MCRINTQGNNKEVNMLDKYFTNEFYKEAAFKKMEAFKRNDKACYEIRGRGMNTATKAKMLDNIAFLRKRYTGQADLPVIKHVELV